MFKFNVGKTYFYLGEIFFPDNKLMTVVNRTDKFITIKIGRGEDMKRNIKYLKETDSEYIESYNRIGGKPLTAYHIVNGAVVANLLYGTTVKLGDVKLSYFNDSVM